MTILSLDSSTVSSEIENMISSNGSIPPQKLAQIWCIPKINLRKRPYSSKITKLESVNSAFLSGLFADVAKASSTEDTGTPDNATHHSKKKRINKNKSIHRCDQSFAVLMKALNQACDNDPIVESCENSNTAGFWDGPSTTTPAASNIYQYTSLVNQIDCFSEKAKRFKSTDASSATSVPFPLLPATISNSSYGNNMNTTGRNQNISSPVTTLTHVISDLQSSDTEKYSQMVTNDTYGWFVEMEDESTTIPQTGTSNDSLPVIDPYYNPKDLAFSAQVAPKAENYDAELEWATAADTVDDVLGCFF
jgi:hypothetical protein